eukprot:gb/GFBE01065239.1/.p1 GENE.gb/GFBE01065239.1/~~gb/GFBE01065239.1/.p1  ORF type:complete len:389 (+),score=75.91 gb/GFBE01065239.1/:1-1167(+)
MSSAAAAESSQKAKKTGDSRLLAALTDVRLKGSQQAVYFTLRGLGMPAIEGPGCIPRIEVFAAKQPQLFVALRRLGLRHDGNRIVVEAKEDQSPVDRASMPLPGGKLSASCSELRRPSGLSECDEKGRNSLRGGSLSAAEHEEFFERMSWPKGVGKKGPYMSALSDAAESLGLVPPRSREEALKTSTSPKGQQASSQRGSRDRAKGEHDDRSPPASPPSRSSTSALPDIPSWWKMSKPRADPAEQKTYCSQLAKPRERSTRSKVLPIIFGPRQQTAEGSAAERHFLARFSRLQAAQQMREAKRDQEEEQRRLDAFSAQMGAGDGFIPPEPSLASLDGGAAQVDTPGRGFRSTDSDIAAEVFGFLAATEKDPLDEEVLECEDALDACPS